MRDFRVIPVLLLQDRGVVKTVRYRKPRYIGDPVNTVRIFNEKEVDELVLLDVDATPRRRPVDVDFVRQIASEAFMPIAYGGGVRTLEEMRTLFRVGVEKVILGAAAAEDPELVRRGAAEFGSQSVLVSVDVRRPLFGARGVYTHRGRRRTGQAPAAYARRMQELGAGEILLNDVDRDGTMQGYDLELVRQVAGAVDVPVVACGGAGSVRHVVEVCQRAGASAAAAGSMFVYQGALRGVLITYPSESEVQRELGLLEEAA